MGLPWGLILKALAVLAVVVAVLAYKHHYDEGQRQIGRDEVQTAWDKDKAARMAQVAEINQERVDAVARADESARESERARTAAFADVRSRIPSGPVGGDTARRVLNAAVAAANGQPAPSASEPATDTASPAELACDYGPWLRWGEQVAELYSAARQQVIDWNKFYNDLRGAH